MGVLEVQDVSDNLAASDESAPKISKFKIFSIGAIGTFLLILLTLIKIPEPRLKSVLIGYLNYGLSQNGIQLLTPDSELSYWKGPELILRNASLISANADPIRFDEIHIKPMILPLFLGKLGVQLSLVAKSSRIDLKALYRAQQLELTVLGDSVDLSRIPILTFVMPEMIGPVKAEGIANINTNLNIDLDAPHTLNGQISLKILKFNLDSISAMGLTVPPLSLSEVLIDLDAQNGKFRIQKGSIGKANTSDDIQATAAGDFTLAKIFDTSALNLKLQFRFSEKVLSAFSILDAVLSPGKRPDGIYGFSLTGSPRQPSFTPIQ